MTRTDSSFAICFICYLLVVCRLYFSSISAYQQYTYTDTPTYTNKTLHPSFLYLLLPLFMRRGYPRLVVVELPCQFLPRHGGGRRKNLLFLIGAVGVCVCVCVAGGGGSEEGEGVVVGVEAGGAPVEKCVFRCVCLCKYMYVEEGMYCNKGTHQHTFIHAHVQAPISPDSFECACAGCYSFS